MPDTHQTTGPTAHEPSPPQAITEGGPTSHGASTKQNTSQQQSHQQQQQAHQSVPMTTALYQQQDIIHGEPRQMV